MKRMPIVSLYSPHLNGLNFGASVVAMERAVSAAGKVHVLCLVVSDLLFVAVFTSVSRNGETVALAMIEKTPLPLRAVLFLPQLAQ